MDPIFAALQVDEQRTRARLPPALNCLAALAWNVAWSWLPDGQALFRDIDSGLWGQVRHSPVAVLERARPSRLAELAIDSAFLARVRALQAAFRGCLEETASPAGERVRQRYGGDPVAYFSAEFGLHESLPIYAGGLGILAGDHLKSASDLGLPLVGVGLRYRQGYFHQRLDSSGWQEEYYEDTDFGMLPMGLILKSDGTPETVTIPLHERRVVLQLWGARIGRVPLLLLDSNRDDNDPVDRWITGHLYGGSRDTRLAQEMVLGIGGVRALRALGYSPAVFHMNEGHAAFLALELMREGLERGLTWDEARAATRGRTVFTTHTPVPAGHDCFTTDQMNTFLSGYLPLFREQGAMVPRDRLLGLGRKYSGDTYEEFNMTHLAIHSARSTNGVSRLHGAVSRSMFHWLWPGVRAEEAPISHVTNGVHAGTWIAPPIRELFNRYLGSDWERRQADPAAWEAVDRIPDAELWEAHCRARTRLVHYARERARAFRTAAGESPEYIAEADQVLDPDILTLGFARRVATYKRLGLLLYDTERAMRLLSLPGRPVQLVIAGKAHPGDTEAKRLLQGFFRVRYDPRVRARGVFLVDYHIGVGREMVQGVDVWLNLPRRPLEASGTSGMKAALNGVLNCSILDGWWAEGCSGDNGWAVGTGRDYADPGAQDAEDAASLYHLLENEIVPLFYERGVDGVPTGWVRRMKESLKSLGPVFNTSRMVGEYAERIYAP